MPGRFGLILRVVFGTLVAAGAGFGALLFLDYQPLWTHEAPSGSFVVGWSPGGKYILTWVASQNVVELRQAENGEVAHRLKLWTVHQDPSYFERDFSPGLPFFACSEDDRWLAAFLAEDPAGTLSLIDA